MEHIISEIIKLQKEFSFNQLKEERETLKEAMCDLSKLANATRQLDRAERYEMNKIKAKITEINTIRKSRLINERIKEIPNIDELSGIGQKKFISRYNNKCRNKICSLPVIKFISFLKQYTYI